MKKTNVPKNQNPPPPPPKPKNEIKLVHFSGAPHEVSYQIQDWYNGNPNIEVISREMSAAYEYTTSYTFVVYFITYKKKV